jgi:hypothetical protein
MPSFRETFPTDLPPSEADVYRVCEWFQVRDVTGATQRAVMALLLPGRDGIASDLRTARDAIGSRLQVLAEQSADAAPEDWTDAHERQLDIAARLADEDQLPEGLTWSAAPPWANGLVSNSTDAYDERQLVWVPALVGEVYGMNAHDFRRMKRGSGQSCSLSHEFSQWVIVAARPPGAVVGRVRE